MSAYIVRQSMCRSASCIVARTIVLSLLVSNLLFLVEGVVASAGADFYVAPDGNDGWSGRSPKANADRTDGPFATLERARDAIRNNYIHHVYHSERWQGAGEGIILDNGCCGILVENNVVHDAVSGGFGTNFNCFGNIIQNNIFAYGKTYQLTVYGDRPTGKPQPKGEIFARNIIVWREGPLIKEDDWPDFKTLWDYNVYFHEGGEPVTFLSGKKYTFEQWKARGMDQHSVIADPLFVDPAGGDFSLKPDSPALKLGFKPIDISTAGPRDRKDWGKD